MSVALAAQGHAGESRYRLGPEDKIRLKVFEWRASQDEVYEWKALNDEFIVSASGALSVPLIGEVPVKGLPPEEVAHVVADRLRQRMGLAAAPDAAIDIVQYRPFFVSGDVIHPGPYPYHPGLTVLEAVAIAGGTPRAGDMATARLSRDVISSEGEIAQLAHDYDAALVRRARLQAEVSGSATIAMPAEFATRRGQAAVTALMQAETLVFQSRQRALTTQSNALTELKSFLEKEIVSLDAQLATIDTQMSLINKELTSVSSLVEKGMAVAPRQLALERSVAQIQGDRLSMQTNKLRVQEEISKADIALIELRNIRSTEAAIELRDTQLKLDELIKKSQTSERLLYEARVTAPRLFAERSKDLKIEPSYAIVRGVGENSNAVGASESTELEPGDTVKVTLPIPTDSYEEVDAAVASGPAASR